MACLIRREWLGLGATVALAVSLGAACGSAGGADPLKGGGGGVHVGGEGAAVAGGGGAGGGGGEGGTTSGGGGEAPSVPDPYQPPADDVATWSGKLPPGGLLDPDTTVYFLASPPPSTAYPLVVYAHGENVGETASEETFRHVAKFGYVVASVEYDLGTLDPDHHAAANSIQAAIDLLTGPDAPAVLAPLVDPSRVAIAGHGLGAKSALWLALEGAPVGAVVAFDPIDDRAGLIPSPKRPSLTPEMMGAMAVPVLYLASELGPGGLTDCVPRESNGCRFFEQTPPGVPAWLAVLEGFGHMQFVDGYDCVACLLCPRGAEAEHAASQTVARGLAVAFLEYTLKAQAGYLSYLEGAHLAELRAKNRVLDEDEEFAFCAEQ